MKLVQRVHCSPVLRPRESLGRRDGFAYSSFILPHSSFRSRWTPAACCEYHLGMAGFLANQRVFVQQFFRRYHTTGAILPSGRSLARALCRYVRDGQGPRRILEVGPGTGAVTASLVGALKPDDHLTLVE